MDGAAVVDRLGATVQYKHTLAMLQEALLKSSTADSAGEALYECLCIRTPITHHVHWILSCEHRRCCAPALPYIQVIRLR